MDVVIIGPQTQHARVVTATATATVVTADRAPARITRISVAYASITLAAAQPSQKYHLRLHMSA